MDFSNKIKTCVDRLGGRTRVANLMQVSGTAVGYWIRQRRVSDITKAQRLAALSGMDLREIRPCR